MKSNLNFAYFKSFGFKMSLILILLRYILIQGIKFRQKILVFQQVMYAVKDKIRSKTHDKEFKPLKCNMHVFFYRSALKKDNYY